PPLMLTDPCEGVPTPRIVSGSPSASKSFCSTGIVTERLKRRTVARSSFATGGVSVPRSVEAAIVDVVLAAALAPALSVTVRVTVNVPLLAYVCIAVADEDVSPVPSPQFHAYVVIV